MAPLIVTGERGWGIMCLDSTHARDAFTPIEASGVPEYSSVAMRRQGLRMNILDSTESMFRIEDSAFVINPAKLLASPVPDDDPPADSDTFDTEEDIEMDDPPDDAEEEDDDEGEDNGMDAFGQVGAILAGLDSTQVPKLPSNFNLMCTGQHEVSLLYNMGANPNDQTKPQLCAELCSRANSQRHDPEHSLDFSYRERLCMTHRIPELGLVFIGNQVGRVAIMTMTRMAVPYVGPPDPDEAKREPPLEPDHVGRPGFRTEAIVPFHSQEKAGKRPLCPLLGMAVGPMQGNFPPKPDRHQAPASALSVETRRYRLVLHYRDHTMLSYEVSRPRWEEPVVII